MTSFTFPFGKPVLPCAPSITGPRPVFTLGAYPSALHIRWQLPVSSLKESRGIRAVAVDNEPEVFWDGNGEEALLRKWKESVGWNPAWGECSPVGHLNGSSGKWVNESVLKPLGISREEVWLTDCLTTYRLSKNLKLRLGDTYQAFSNQIKALPPYHLPPHPSENAIVREAIASQKNRLLEELQQAKPELVITLGNAALRVLRDLAAPVTGTLPQKLSAEAEVYGKRHQVRISHLGTVAWLPLAHPGARGKYQEIHDQWTRAK